MTLGVFDELIEVKGLIYLTQIIMKKSFVRVFDCSLKLLSDRSDVVIRIWRGFSQELQKPPCLSYLLNRILEASRMEAHHAANEITQVVPWVGVVADISYALRVQHFPTNSQNALPSRLRNPGVQAVGDDKVESPKSLGTCFAKIHRMQTEIPQAQLSDENLARSDRTPRQVKTHKLAF